MSNRKCCVGVLLLAVSKVSVDGFTIRHGQQKHLIYNDLGLQMIQTVDKHPTTTKSDDFVKQEIEKHLDDIHSSLTDDSNVSNEVTHSPPTASGVTNRRDPRPFPLSLIVDQQEIKHALLLSAVNSRAIGVVLSGGRGTGKSVIARSMQQIVPSHISRIKE